jgi:hypothetical protein
MKTRKQYVSAMIDAIELARKDNWTGIQTTRADALRAIKRFERINGVEFDPFCHWHLRVIEGKGLHEDFTRRAKRLKIFNKTQTHEHEYRTTRF